jgi:hypothetical protein
MSVMVYWTVRRRQQPGEKCECCGAQRRAWRLSSWAVQPHSAGRGEPCGRSGTPLQPPRAPLRDRARLRGSEASWRRNRGTSICHQFPAFKHCAVLSVFLCIGCEAVLSVEVTNSTELWIRIWKEAVLAYFKVLYQHSSGETEENLSNVTGNPAWFESLPSSQLLPMYQPARHYVFPPVNFPTTVFRFGMCRVSRFFLSEFSFFISLDRTVLKSSGTFYYRRPACHILYKLLCRFEDELCER